MTTERWFVQDITQPIVVQHCEGVVFTADNNGNVIGVRLYDGGIPISPGGTATCNVIRPDGVTVSFDGTVSGNAISATLPVTALAVPGVIGIVLQSISVSVVTTVFKGQFTCELTTTETVVAPSVPTSSLAQLTQDVIDLQTKFPVTVAQGGTGDTAPVDGAITSTASTVTVSEARLRRWGRVVTVSGYFTSTSALNAYVTLFTLPDGFRSTTSPVVNTTIFNSSTGASLLAYTGSSGTFICRNGIAANTTYWFGFTFVM